MKMSSGNAFLKTEPIQDDHPSDIVDEEQIQLSLDPKFQILLAQMSRESGCWGKFFPIPFERASQKSWWDPTFDSEILEDQYKKSAFTQYRFKFRYAVCYTIFMSLCWLVYLSCQAFLTDVHPVIYQLILLSIIFFCNVLVIFFSWTKRFQKHLTWISLVYAVASVVLCLVFILISQQAQFGFCIQLLILIYTLLPLKLYMALTVAVVYSCFFEWLIVFYKPAHLPEDVLTVFTKILSYFAIHLIGLHIYLMNNVRMRQTFMKVGQSLLVRKQLELEKRLKENMIHSLMPPSVAKWLMNEDESFARRPSSEADLCSLFRPFIMDTMNNVSILFADIVGFTKMSSTKSAEELVEILNNLFQRFDDLCKQHCCEKISTLGDCYYCVSGCPQARPDHARCCVEMGLSMIQAIKQFDREKHEGINMRVGIHTGTVLCGIVGIKRFKFDVWSNDVTLANKMESTGKPGMVHVSEKTRTFLGDQYLLEDGEDVSGMKTYFILGRKPDNCPSYQGSVRSEGRQKYAHSLQLFVSPPPSVTSLSPHTRPRVLSCDTTHLKSPQNKNFLSPDSCIVKASSLPSILDSENEQEPGDGANVESVKTPTSTASSGKYSIKLKNWKIPKFMRKTSTGSSKPDIDVDFVSGATDASEDGYQQVPAIIETSALNGKKKDSVTTLTSKYEDDPMCKDTIDIKSYISHSRSDVGAFDFAPGVEFIRGGSYRGQYGRGDFPFLSRTGSSRSRRGRSPNLDVMEPYERARSATITVGNFPRPKRSFDVPSRLSSMAMLDEEMMSHSRKDSGIKSASRKSSLQIDNRLLNQDRNHRVSGYYTSSQASVTSQQTSKMEATNQQGPFFDKYGTCIQHLRKQSDRQLIKCVQDNSNSQGSYFIKPPLSMWTLFFKTTEMERDYRNMRLTQEGNVHTLPNSRFNTYVDVTVACVVFLVVSSSLAFVYGVTPVWLGTLIGCGLLQLFQFGVCLHPTLQRHFSGFYLWNCVGGILITIPMFSAVLNYLVSNSVGQMHHMFTYPLFVGLLHFCNFTQLNCWMKNAVATLLSVVFALFFALTPKSNWDVLLHLFGLLVLVWLLNRQFEIDYRLSFHANLVAQRDKAYVQCLKDQADYLIFNIVPKHVAEQLKKDAKYSENFKNVGIIFASIVNFNEMYDESFEGGKEYLRVLNELVGDFDELLEKEHYLKHIEKIKTIGSTFMAASGLNSQMRQKQTDPHEHLYALMDFALDMQKVVDKFNEDLLEFNLIIRIGYNFGDVTAAVIGNTKLYYDIWGDAVNIASRMDSTGVNGRVQVGQHCLEVLEQKFEFEHRGPVYVKGKDNMDVYLLKGPKKGDEIES